jgi:FMN phosphatase YigB (HAD superfamily)
VEQAVEKGAEGLDWLMRSVIQNAYEAYVKALEHVPPLLPGVLHTLAHIRACRATNSSIATLIFSEGDPVRLERIIEAHNIHQHGCFNEIIIGPKTIHAFKCAGDAGRRYLSLSQGSDVVTVVIGDSLERDIRNANAAGYITVYIPGAFNGPEIPQTAIDHPKFQIDSILKLRSILESLGFPPVEYGLKPFDVGN